MAIELFAGAFGWGEGLIAAGWRTIGFDIEHQPYHGPVPEHAELVLQDVRTLHGAQFKDAQLIVASPPCQRYSWMAMPWKLAKEKAAWYRADPYRQIELNALFNACFRIQLQASIAAGRKIPMVVENVKGAQPWVGRAAWHFGSFYLFGDVPTLMPINIPIRKSQHQPLCETPKGTGKTSRFFGNSKHEGRAEGLKNDGGSWFAQAHNTESGHSRNPVNGIKVASEEGRRADVGKGARFTSRDCGIEGTKQGGDWFGAGEDCSISRRTSSKSSARKAASASIAKIPYPLALYIGEFYFPRQNAGHVF